MADVVLDLKGLKCPQPAIRAKRQLKLMTRGQTLEAICTDPLASIDIPHLVRQLQLELVSQSKTQEALHFVIRV